MASKHPQQRVTAKHQLSEDLFMKAQLHPLSLLSVCLLANGAALAEQQQESILPKPVPQLVESPQQATPQTNLQDVFRAMAGATAGEKILLPRLLGILFIEHESELGKIATDNAFRSNFKDFFPHLNHQEMQLLLDSFIDQPVSQESLKRLKTSLRLYLAQKGMPFSIIYTPPQDITDGYIQLVVKQSRIGEIRVEGNSHFSTQTYLSRVPQKSGDFIDPQTLKAAMDRINSNPFRAAATRVEKGKQAATTDIIIQARERKPLRGFVGYNNTGTDSTTEDRMYAGVNWGNAFGLGHQMTLQATADLDIHHSKALSGNYIIDLPENHNLTLFASYNRINSIGQPTTSQQGTSWQLGLNYDWPWKKVSQNYAYKTQLGIDFKSSDNNLELNLPPFVIPIVDNETHVAQVRAQYNGKLHDDLGSTTFGVKATLSPGGIGSNNSDAAFDASRSGATADYAYANLDIARNTLLPGAFDGWEWNIRSQIQLASGNLVSSEQFSAGGSNTVRGYQQGEISGDNAAFFSQELVTPNLTPGKSLFDAKYPDSLKLYLFQDYARTWNTDPLPNEKAFNIHSAGLGLRYQFYQTFNAQLSYGWQLRDSGSNNRDDKGRLHASIQLNF